MKETTLKALATLSVLGLFIGLLGSIVYFVINPGVFSNFKSVASYFVELLLIGGLIKYLVKRIKKIIEVEKSLSKAVTSLLIKEPLVHSMIWILIIFQMFVFIYLLPIHYISISVKDGSDLLNMDVVDAVKVLSGEKNLLLDKSRVPAAIYSSQRQLAWGDPLALRIEAEGYTLYSESLSWPGLVFLNIFSGIKLDVNLTRIEPVSLYLMVSPASSQVEIKSASLDTNIIGSGNIRVQKNEVIEITLSARGHAAFDTTFVAVNDLELKKDLKKIIQNGTLTLIARTEGGREIQKMDVFIDGKKQSQKSDQPISLKPGNYMVSMEKILSVDEKAVVVEFSVKILSDKELKIKDLVILIEHI